MDSHRLAVVGIRQGDDHPDVYLSYLGIFAIDRLSSNLLKPMLPWSRIWELKLFDLENGPVLPTIGKAASGILKVLLLPISQSRATTLGAPP